MLSQSSRTSYWSLIAACLMGDWIKEAIMIERSKPNPTVWQLHWVSETKSGSGTAYNTTPEFPRTDMLFPNTGVRLIRKMDNSSQEYSINFCKANSSPLSVERRIRRFRFQFLRIPFLASPKSHKCIEGALPANGVMLIPIPACTYLVFQPPQNARHPRKWINF